MARAGRKRKDVARRNDGDRVDWRAVREDPAVATKWHKGRDHFLEGLGGNPRLASQAGKLFALRLLTALEVEVVDRWCEWLVTNRRVVVGMTGEIHGSALDRVGSGMARERDPEWVREFSERFNAAQDYVVLTCGKPALMALNRLCRDEAAMMVLPEAKRALAALIAHFRLGPQKPA
jgi:hypothetical protein